MKRRFLPLLLSLALILPLCPAALAAADTSTAQTSYVTAPGETVSLNAEDFKLLCRQQTGHELASVTFDAIPRETGDLWYRRDRSTGWKVSTSSICEANTLSDITFLPAKGFLGQAEVGFTLTSEKKEKATGTLLLRVSAPAADLVLTNGLDLEALDGLCREKTGDPLWQITFGYPTSGSWTYDKEGVGPIPGTDRMTYYVNDPDQKYDLARLTYNAGGQAPYAYVEVKGRSVKKEGFTATILMDGKDHTRPNFSYEAAAGTPIRLDPKKLVYSGGTTTVTLPPSEQGTFWVDYGEKYARKLLPGEELTTLDGTLTFVPAKVKAANYLIDLPGKNGDGKSDLRVLSLTYRPVKPAKGVYYYTQTDTLYLHSWNFIQACAAREAGDFVSLRFDALPDPKQGRLFWGSTAVKTGKEYDKEALTSFVFIPGPDFDESLDVPYTGTDSNHITYNGTLRFVYGPYKSTRFDDLVGWSWAAPGVDRLDQIMAPGRRGGNFRPADKATRLDILRAIVALAYPAGEISEHPDAPFPDLPENGIHAGSVNIAYAHGLVEGNEAGLLEPDGFVTRQDALVLCCRAMAERGQDLPAPADLSDFADADQVAPYARDAVAALVAAGVIKGTGAGLLAPTAQITRAEAAAIAHRAFPA